MKNNVLKFSLLALFFLTYTLPAWADIDPPESEDDPLYEEAPIDNWEILLVMAAIAVGIYFVSKYRKPVQQG